MSKESDQWAEDKSNGTLDDPIFPDWKIPLCNQCSNHASLAVMRKAYALGTLNNPPYKDAIFYCYNHYPEKYK